MSSKLLHFVKVPNQWIEQHGLHAFGWKDQGADNLAALMALAVIAHHADPKTGVARITYSDLESKASLSRAKIAAGLTILSDRQLIDRAPEGRSSFGLKNYDPDKGWAMLPASGLYRDGVVEAFRSFHLRQRAELDAMKLYFLFASRRARNLNMAVLSYSKIQLYSGVGENYVRRALTVLGANGLVHVERLNSTVNEYATSSGYRLGHLEPRRHPGTSGRQIDFTAFAEAITTTAPTV